MHDAPTITNAEYEDLDAILKDATMEELQFLKGEIQRHIDFRAICEFGLRCPVLIAL